MEANAFFKKLEGIPDIPTLPNIVFKVNKMLEDYDVPIKELSAILEKDQAMVTKILKLVNSSFYGFRSRIHSISHAVVILGFNTVRNALVSVSIIKAFSRKEPGAGFDITDFWKHSIGVAVTSRYLSEQSKLDSPDDCFVAGLLHDIGKVILAQHFTELFDRVWESVKGDGRSFYEAEQELLPVNHAQIGGYLTKKWQFPDALIDSIAYHHAIGKSVSGLNQLLIVHTADNIVNTYQADAATSGGFPSLDPEAKRTLFRQVESVSDWFPNIANEIDAACEFFLAED
jgi:putative nucleotidyltransferase with HDIG domain